MSSAIHRTVCDSISVAAGDSVHAPTFGFTAAASRSPSMPIGAGAAVMYPKKRGCPLNSEWSNSSRAVSFQQRARVHARFRERAREAERVAHRGGRLVAGHRAARHRLEELRDLVHEPMAQRAERRGVHRERRTPGRLAVAARFLCR